MVSTSTMGLKGKGEPSAVCLRVAHSKPVVKEVSDWHVYEEQFEQKYKRILRKCWRARKSHSRISESS